MKIFTSSGLKRIDQLTIERLGITTPDLVERAAQAIAYEVMSRWRPNKRIVIFAGPGNNGADALAVARIIAESGYSPEVYLFNTKAARLSIACSTNHDRLKQVPNVKLQEIVNTFEPPELGPNDVVIDGIFGSGLNAPLHGGFRSLVSYINESNAYVVSIDVPCGLAGEWNQGHGRIDAIEAHLTLTFQCKRLSFFFAENAKYLGQVKVLDLDMDPDAIVSTPTDYYLVEEADARAALRPHDPFINKYNNGTVFLVAGSYGMMGAASISARAAMRAGAGLVTVHAPRCGFMPLAASVPEVLFEADRNEIITSQIDLHHRYSVVALGPGMGTAEETREAVGTFLKNCRQPCILDADALNCIALNPILLRSIPRGSILTPHEAEFDRLFGEHTCDEERLKKAINMSRLYEVTIVLKGRYSMTVRPDGKVYINSTGNPGMATAGSGDALTGIIAAFIAQGYEPDWAVVLAVWLHGRAGDMVMAEQGTHGVIAPDIANAVGRAIASVMHK